LKIFRELLQEAISHPHHFTRGYNPPELLSKPVVRRPKSPLARILSTLVRNTAAGNTLIKESKPEWRRGDFKSVYSKEDVQVLEDSFAAIPAGMREMLAGRIMDDARKQAAFWTKGEALICAAPLTLDDRHFTVIGVRKAIARAVQQRDGTEQDEVGLYYQVIALELL
jgi:hypothetical protein